MICSGIAPSLIAAPASLAVTLEEAKAHVRPATDEDDGFIMRLISAAVDGLEGWHGNLGGLCLVDQVWRDTLSGFPVERRLPLNLAPVAEILSITYFDEENVLQTLDPAAYSIPFRSASGVPFIVSSAWPTAFTREDAVSVTYRVGYGPDGSAVPPALRQAILLLVGHWYENRENTIVGTSISDLPDGAGSLLDRFRRYPT